MSKCFVQVKEDVYFVILSKDEGSGLGFSIAGGMDLEQKSITVKSPVCFPSSYIVAYVSYKNIDLFCAALLYFPIMQSVFMTFFIAYMDYVGLEKSLMHHFQV